MQLGIKRMLAITAKEYGELNKAEVFIGQNQYDGSYMIEVWKKQNTKANEHAKTDKQKTAVMFLHHGG